MVNKHLLYNELIVTNVIRQQSSDGTSFYSFPGVTERLHSLLRFEKIPKLYCHQIAVFITVFGNFSGQICTVMFLFSSQFSIGLLQIKENSLHRELALYYCILKKELRNIYYFFASRTMQY